MPVSATPSGLRGRDFRLLLLATMFAASNFWPLLAVLPLWAASGGTGHSGVGTITAVMMAATVGGQLAMPWLLRAIGLRILFAVGAILMGLPAFFYAASSDLPWILTLSAIRGIGFGLFVVAGTALASQLVPHTQRGRALGLYGGAVGLPNLLFLPLGVWYAQTFGYAAVFITTAVAAVLAAPIIAALTTTSSSPSAQGDTPRDPWPLRAYVTPTMVLLITACAMGGITAFLALALGEGSAAPIALFAAAAGVIAGRWGHGMWADRGPGVQLALPALALAALGMGGLAAAATWDTASTLVAITAGALYGLGFGAVQNDTLMTMLRRAGPRGNGSASTVWNVGFDAGTGLGSVVVGLVAAGVGIPGAFATMGGVMAAMAVLLLVSGVVAARRVRAHTVADIAPEATPPTPNPEETP